ncbi:MAG TPA: hypothetical protein VHO67_05460, partial [Polyangia bacterium]|nr:hypothetical protein [Polyangia bacterium]
MSRRPALLEALSLLVAVGALAAAGGCQQILGIHDSQLAQSGPDGAAAGPGTGSAGGGRGGAAGGSVAGSGGVSPTATGGASTGGSGGLPAT